MENKYGIAAVEAAKSIQLENPSTRWSNAVQRIFPGQLQSQKKGCPRSAFLGLCEEGLVRGIPAGDYTNSKDNKAYALLAIELLRSGSQPTTALALWNLVMRGQKKAHNGQADVVLALWRNGLIQE